MGEGAKRVRAGVDGRSWGLVPLAGLDEMNLFETLDRRVKHDLHV